jgi:SAM-dependent methyltransferase
VITGERVSAPEGGFNPTFQRHVAAYRLCAPLLPPGRVLDLGCGVGHSFRELEPRETVGVDIDAGALAGQARETHVADMRRLPFADCSFDSVLAVQSLEHVPDPGRVLGEVMRALVPHGRAVFVTPNRLTFGPPDEIIDPFHFVEFDASELRELCGKHFAGVEIFGLFGSARYSALVEAERRELERLLRLDPLRLRRLLPRHLRQLLYDRRLKATRSVPQPRALEITPDDFRMAPAPLTSALDLIAVCDKR